MSFTLLCVLLTGSDAVEGVGRLPRFFRRRFHDCYHLLTDLADHGDPLTHDGDICPLEPADYLEDLVVKSDHPRISGTYTLRSVELLQKCDGRWHAYEAEWWHVDDLPALAVQRNLAVANGTTYPRMLLATIDVDPHAGFESGLRGGPPGRAFGRPAKRSLVWIEAGSDDDMDAQSFALDENARTCGCRSPPLFETDYEGQPREHNYISGLNQDAGIVLTNVADERQQVHASILTRSEAEHRQNIANLELLCFKGPCEDAAVLYDEVFKLLKRPVE